MGAGAVWRVVKSMGGKGEGGLRPFRLRRGSGSRLMDMFAESEGGRV